MAQIKINSLSKKIIRHAFLDTIFWSTAYNMSVILIININGDYEKEYLKILLEKNNVYYMLYLVPNEFFLIVFNNYKIEEVEKDFKDFDGTVIKNNSQILDHISNVNWEYSDLDTHLLVFNSDYQNLIGEYLDSVAAFSDFIPDHWEDPLILSPLRKLFRSDSPEEMLQQKNVKIYLEMFKEFCKNSDMSDEKAEEFINLIGDKFLKTYYYN